jgi:hypothetical protein
MIISGLTMATPSLEAVAAPATVALSCLKGEALISPTAQTTDALGVTRYSYRAVPGLVAMLPARGLVADKITPAVLKDLGVPTMPDLTSAQVRTEVARESRTPPEFCRSAAIAQCRNCVSRSQVVLELGARRTAVGHCRPQRGHGVSAGARNRTSRAAGYGERAPQRPTRGGPAAVRGGSGHGHAPFRRGGARSLPKRPGKRPSTEMLGSHACGSDSARTRRPSGAGTLAGITTSPA